MSDCCYEPGQGLVSVEQARALLLEHARPVTSVETLATEQCLGRVLARDVVSAIDVPPWDNSAMDGYALNVDDLDPSTETVLPVSQRITAGSMGDPLAAGTAARIFTGAPVPAGANAVVMQEKCSESNGHVTIPADVSLQDNIRPRGNDLATGKTVLGAGMRLMPQHLGMAATVGEASLTVYRRLRVAIFSTGDELVLPGTALGDGQIYNSNRYLLLGLLQRLDCEVVDLGLIADNFDATCEALRQAAAEADIVLTSGGVSVGEEDHVKHAVETVGQLEMWRVAMKPGKPVAFGSVESAEGRRADFIGLPGNPVSTYVTFCLFVRPFLLQRQGAEKPLAALQAIPVRAGFQWEREGPRREFVRARLEHDESGQLQAVLFPRQGSDVLSAVVWADGLVEIPERQRIQRGDSVGFISLAGLLA